MANGYGLFATGFQLKNKNSASAEFFLVSEGFRFGLNIFCLVLILDLGHYLKKQDENHQ